MTADTPQEATGSQAGRRLIGKDVGLTIRATAAAGKLMQARAPRVPWWYFALTGVVITAVLGLLLSHGVGWPVQIGVIMLVLLGLMVVVRRDRM